MQDVEILVHVEAAQVDPARISALVGDLGEAAAQRMLRRGLAEIAEKLVKAEDAYVAGNAAALAKAASRLTTLGDQLGLSGLAHVACDVGQLSASRDGAALAATMARLGRVGAASAGAVWQTREAGG